MRPDNGPREALVDAYAAWRRGVSNEPPPWVAVELDTTSPATHAVVTAVDVVDGEPWLVHAKLTAVDADGIALTSTHVEHLTDPGSECVGAMHAVHFAAIRDRALCDLEVQASAYEISGSAFPILIGRRFVGWERRADVEQRVSDTAERAYTRRVASRGGRPGLTDEEWRTFARACLQAQEEGVASVRAALAQRLHLTEGAVKKRIREARALKLLARDDGRYVPGPEFETGGHLQRRAAPARQDLFLANLSQWLAPLLQDLAVEREAAVMAVREYLDATPGTAPESQPRSLFTPIARWLPRLKWSLRRARDDAEAAAAYADAIATVIEDVFAQVVPHALDEPETREVIRHHLLRLERGT